MASFIAWHLTAVEPGDVVESLSCALPVWRHVHFYSNKIRGFCLRAVFCIATNSHISTKFLKKDTNARLDSKINIFNLSCL